MSERLRVDVSMVWKSPGLGNRDPGPVWTVKFYEGGGSFAVALGAGPTCIRALRHALASAPPSHREACESSWHTFIAENPWLTFAPVDTEAP